MKRILFIISFISIFIITRGQEYQPMIGETNEWYLLQFFEGYITDSYETKGDTTINETSYMIFGLKDALNVYGYIREDSTNKKVYLLPNSEIDNHERLLYDFSLEEKDSIYLDCYYEFVRKDTLNWYYVDSIRTINTLLGASKIFYLHGSYAINTNNLVYNERPIWIEGIGTLGDPKFSNTSPDEFTGNLSCFFKDNIKLYQSEISKQFDKCEIWSSTGTESSSISFDIQIYPNPSSGLLNIDIPKDKEFSICIYDLNSTKLYEIANTENLDLSYLNNGMYILSILIEETIVTKRLILNK